MRVGILTLFHGNNNWGGDLQGYALKAYIEDNFKNTNVDSLAARRRDTTSLPAFAPARHAAVRR